MNYLIICQRFICLFLLLNFSSAVHSQQTDNKARIQKTYNNIYRYFASDRADLFIETTDTAKNEKPYSFLWPVCALIQSANEMEVLEPGKEYLSPVLKTIAY